MFIALSVNCIDFYLPAVGGGSEVASGPEAVVWALADVSPAELEVLVLPSDCSASLLQDEDKLLSGYTLLPELPLELLCSGIADLLDNRETSVGIFVNDM